MGTEFSTPMNHHSTPMDHGQVLAFHSPSKWKSHFDAHKSTNKIMVIEFMARWCRPCVLVEPYFDELATIYTNVEFIKIDVDELPSVAREYGVQAMPSFVLVKSGRMVDMVIGAKIEELNKRIQDLQV